MKVCSKCQFVGNDNEVYCVKCGALLTEQAAEPAPEAPQPAPEAPQPAPEAPQAASEAPQAPQMPPYAPYAYPQPPKEEVSVGKWILYHLIPCIPFVGSLVFLVMLFVWGFGNDKNETFRNWAKSQLIIMAISFGIVLILFILMFVILGFTMADFASEFSQY